MFNEITQPTIRLRARQWYTVPVSMLAHAVALLALAVVPLLATGDLPMPFLSTMDVFLTPPPPPLLPPPPIAPDLVVPPLPTFDPTMAPIAAPSTFSPEPPPSLPHVIRNIPGAFASAPATTIVAPRPAPIPTPPIRVGGDIKAPAKVFGPRPVYPPVARAARMSGTVFLEAVIATDGRVKDLRVTRSAGPFDQAALEAVREWRYTPTMLNGEAVEVLMSVTVNFTLN